jgi:ribonucleotide monophosphatase NagD (HAD superfamily)
MIGDRLSSDIRPARLLGSKTIRVAQGFAGLSVAKGFLR